MSTSTTPIVQEAAIQQPPWKEPTLRPNHPSLHVFNTLTRTKVPFYPASGDNRLRWYSCGPTVYDAAHLGHARNYVTFDIIRRLLQDYFKYDILFIMNITDVDDKIILRARQAYLLKEFGKEHPVVDECLLKELSSLLSKFALSKSGLSCLEEGDWFEVARLTLSEDDAKGLMYLETIKKAHSALLHNSEHGISSSSLLQAFEDILAPHLDELKGATINDPKISRNLASYWEADFLADMKELGVLEADAMTRVSEYIPEIIEYVQGIMKNGYAYVTEEGSVYFNVSAFQSTSHHHYAKLCPWNAGNSKFFEEGEGALGMKLAGKRDPRDFALWKASKAGEPHWESPWGRGRPGWHIECSAMAGAVAPGVLDIHSGGIDLAFPHHDNEIAQAEAYTGCTQWVNYFLHAGHVHIEGHKMSKSLKNFITIKECLKRYTARQLRFMFLQHQWSSPVTFKEASMQGAIAAEASFFNFFSNLSHSIHHSKEFTSEQVCGNGDNNFAEPEKNLMSFTDSVKDRVHVALCDSFDTPTALSALLDLVNKCNVYSKQKASNANPSVLLYAAKYISKTLQIFGVTELPKVEKGADQSTVNSTDIQGILEAVSEFRDLVREITKSSAPRPERYFQASDRLRTELSGFGVVFEDQGEGRRSIVKLIDARREKDSSNDKGLEVEELSKRTAALQLKQLQADRAAAKMARAQIPPSELFLSLPEASALYSRYDERGVPTHDASGEVLSKSARKRLIKEYEQQVELHAKHKCSHAK